VVAQPTQVKHGVKERQGHQDAPHDRLQQPCSAHVCTVRARCVNQDVVRAQEAHMETRNDGKYALQDEGQSRTNTHSSEHETCRTSRWK
jgi:hypothetical protein